MIVIDPVVSVYYAWWSRFDSRYQKNNFSFYTVAVTLR